MGASPNAQINSSSKYVTSKKFITKTSMIRMFSVLLQYDFVYRHSNLCKEEIELLKNVHSFSRSLIAQRRKELLSTKGNETNGDKSSNALDLMLNSTNQLTDEEIREEIDSLLFIVRFCHPFCILYRNCFL